LEVAIVSESNIRLQAMRRKSETPKATQLKHRESPVGGGSPPCGSGARWPLPSIDVADALLDERRELTGLPGVSRCLDYY
jgi:hypothetical protein